MGSNRRFSRDHRRADRSDADLERRGMAGEASRGGLAILGLAVLAAGGIWFATGCGPGTSAGPSVLIISVDTLRPDHMSCYGYPRETTPCLDDFAARGMLFEDVVTPRPKTTPSMVSMLTGLYPHAHGIRTNFSPLPGVELVADPEAALRPSADGPGTLAERLAHAGMKTGAFVSNFVLTRERSGLQRGFDVFDDELTSSERLRKNIKERKASDSTDRAIAWLDEHGDDSFFLWVHYIDPHGSYSAPETHLEKIKALEPAPLTSPSVVPLVAADRQKVVKDALGHRIFVARHNLLPSESNPSKVAAKTQTYVDAYDAEISYMDAEVGRLLDSLDDLGLDERTLVVFTSDHGESLGEHSCFFEHGFYIYEASSKIPLIVSSPEMSEANRGRRIREPVDLLDIYPTVLNWLGLETPKDLPGKSLLSVFAGETPPADRISYIERNAHAFNMRSVRSSDWKLIYNFQVPSNWPIPAPRELYHLKTDPHETKNLYASKRKEVQAIRDEFDRLLLDWARKSGDLRSFAGDDGEAIRNLPADARTQLEEMGYLDPAMVGDPEDSAESLTSETEMEEFAEATPPADATPQQLLLWALLGDRPELRALALDAMTRAGALPEGTLRDYLSSSHPLHVRCRAAELLGETASTESQDLQTLEQTLETASQGEEALIASCAYGLVLKGVETAQSSLLGGLDHWNAAIRARCAWYVGKLGEKANRKALEKLRRDPVPEVRVFALRSLGQLGSDVVEDLIAVIEEAARGGQPDEIIDPHTVVAGVLALGELGGKPALEDLNQRLAEKKNPVLLNALVEAQARAIPSFARDLLPQLQSAPAASKRRLLNAVASSLGKEARPFLERSFADPDPELKVLAAVHLLDEISED